jgi:hypothetical protein
MFSPVFKTSMGMPGATTVAQQQVAITTASAASDGKL